MFESAKNDQDGQRDSQHDHRCGESNHDALIQFYVFPTPYGPANQCLPQRAISDEADGRAVQRREVRPLAGEPRSSKPLTELVTSPRHPRIESATGLSLCQ